MNRYLGIILVSLLMCLDTKGQAIETITIPLISNALLINDIMKSQLIGQDLRLAYMEQQNTTNQIIEGVLGENVSDEDEENKQTVTLSFAGDTTLGTYYGQGKGNRFDEIYNREGDSYFFENVYPIFSEDDLTIVNLEGTFTDVGEREEKQFAIKGEPEYASILNEGDIEIVSLANNHTYDYGEAGYDRTKEVLGEYDVGYFGEDTTYYTEVNGIDIAFIGAKGWSNSKYVKDTLAKRIGIAEENADLVIMMFHWGIEREYYPNSVQKDLARYVIDEGVDLVLGSHPHVVQGIETYKGKNIVYSLGNFSFGANKNPSDKDTFIYQETFELTEEGIESIDSKVIPCRISSVITRNDYRPTPLEGEEAENVMKRIETYSQYFEKSYFDTKP